MDRYKIGIIGYGYIATVRHIPSYKKDKRAEITSIVGPDIDKAKKIAKKEKIPYFFDSLDDMLDLDLDIVSVCTPPGTHSEITIRALERGCNVLVEKPMAMNTIEANKMIEASKKYNKSLCVAHNFLFSKSMLKVKDMIENNEIGEIQDVNAIQISSVKRNLPIWYPSLPGKLFFDEVPHMIYMLREFIPNLYIKDINKVSLAKNYPSDNIYVDFSSNNIIGTLKMIFNAACSEWKVIVVGTKKVIIIDLFRDNLLILSEEKSHSPTAVLHSTLSLIEQNISNTLDSGVRLLTKNLLFGHDKLICKFIDSIDTNTEPPISPEDGINGLKTVEYIVNQLTLEANMEMDTTFYSLRI